MPSIHTLIFQVAALACAAGLAACVSVTPYQPASKGYGYSEQRIENNRFRINFAGNSDTPKQTVETYLLFRDAELTLKSGYDYFVFASDRTAARPGSIPRFDGIYDRCGPYL